MWQARGHLLVAGVRCRLLKWQCDQEVVPSNAAHPSAIVAMSFFRSLCRIQQQCPDQLSLNCESDLTIHKPKRQFCGNLGLKYATWHGLTLRKISQYPDGPILDCVVRRKYSRPRVCQLFRYAAYDFVELLVESWKAIRGV
jgi:hypothetical protein